LSEKRCEVSEEKNVGMRGGGCEVSEEKNVGMRGGGEVVKSE
jgi:hypothetical protein